MDNVIRERFKKSENEKASVEAEGNRRVKARVAKSFTVEDDGADWVLITVLKQIS